MWHAFDHNCDTAGKSRTISIHFNVLLCLMSQNRFTVSLGRCVGESVSQSSKSGENLRICKQRTPHSPLPLAVIVCYLLWLSLSQSHSPVAVAWELTARMWVGLSCWRCCRLSSTFELTGPIETWSRKVTQPNSTTL